MEIRAIGIDLGKSIFHLAAVDARGQVVQRKKLSRLQLLRYTGTLRACLIGMVAGAGAHYLGRRLLAQGSSSISRLSTGCGTGWSRDGRR